MTEPGGLDERYVGFREHAQLSDRVTRLEAGLQHVPAELSRLSRAHEGVEARLIEVLNLLRATGERSSQVPDALTGAVLALHRGIEAQANAATTRAAPSIPVPVFVMIAAGLLFLGALMGAVLGLDNLLRAGGV